MKNDNEKYCSHCGEIITSKAEICPKCGVRQPGYETYSPFRPIATDDPTISPNSWLITLLLCGFLGPLGVHRFYNNKMGTGILMLLTGGGCGIWYLIDLVLILIGKFTDDKGRFVKNM